ncbi:unnamed protein product [Paramecium pentaurelia]|uniref:Uncharacterized protein n=1 Tax=Paramecium pentaurelia TaxID=43138 RepID=A0A8S1XID5_9CILI|nr:unnamed protein product [Paramecium pentaurelia]
MSNTKFPSVSINEKLQKRILRSKIVKILNSQFQNYCHKFLKIERLQSEIETRKCEFDLEDQNLIQLLPIHPPMKFTQEEKHHCQRMNINIPTPLEMQQKLKAQLTHQELLEIGEDPAYFIQDEEMRRLNWNEEDWLSKSHTHLKKEMKDIPKIKSNSNLLKIKKPTIRSNTEDRTERKNKMIDEQVKRLHEINEINFQKVKYNQETKEMEKQKEQAKMNEKFKSKIDVQIKKQDAKHESHQRIAEFKQQQQQMINEKMDQHKKRIIEEEEMIRLHQRLKQICQNKQVNSLIDLNLKDRIEKAIKCQTNK